jgi:hypothetical protein
MSSARYLNVNLERSPVGLGLRKVAQWVDYSDFTDGGSTAGTITLDKQIPAGSFVIGSKVHVVTGFTGDTSCVLDIGDGSDADAFSLTTHNIYTAADNLMEVCDVTGSGDAGLVPISTDTSVVLTATSASDWTSVSAGRLFVEVFYLSTNVELDESYPNRLAKSI